jgi:hypothetical protein
MLDICNISKTGRKRTYTSRSSPEDTTQTTDEPSKRVRRAASGTLHTEVRVIDIDPEGPRCKGSRLTRGRASRGHASRGHASRGHASRGRASHGRPAQLDLTGEGSGVGDGQREPLTGRAINGNVLQRS